VRSTPSRTAPPASAPASESSVGTTSTSDTGAALVAAAGNRTGFETTSGTRIVSS